MLRIDNVDAYMRNYLTMVMRTSNNIAHHLSSVVILVLLVFTFQL